LPASERGLTEGNGNSDLREGAECIDQRLCELVAHIERTFPLKDRIADTIHSVHEEGERCRAHRDF
jgi:hypothetical protein